jgi:hypothetical protein
MSPPFVDKILINRIIYCIQLFFFEGETGFHHSGRVVQTHRLKYLCTRIYRYSKKTNMNSILHRNSVDRGSASEFKKDQITTLKEE